MENGFDAPSSSHQAVECSSTTQRSSLVPFAEVESVANGWMLDFACRCLCRHFCESNRADFERSRDLALTIINGLQRKETYQVETVSVCQLLAYFTEGKSFDSHFVEEGRLSPLENALSVWTSFLKQQSRQDKLQKDIEHLLQIQAVAVFMGKGYFKEAAEILERIFPESFSNEPLRMKLSAVIKGKDPYHPFLRRFSFSLLTEKIKTYINIFLKKETNSFLMKEATKKVETKNAERMMELIPCDSTIGAVKETRMKTTQKTLLKLHKSSCSSSDQSFWKPVQRQASQMPRNKKRNALQCKKNLENIENVPQDEELKSPDQKKKRWSWEEDQKLKKGVQEFGIGNWITILQNYDFADRTNVMLKDRWRTLVKLGLA